MGVIGWVEGEHSIKNLRINQESYYLEIKGKKWNQGAIKRQQ